MKLFRLSVLAVLTLSVALGGAGCKRKPKPLTYIPGQKGGTGDNADTRPQPPVGDRSLESANRLPGEGNTARPIEALPVTPVTTNPEGVGLAPFNLETAIQDREKFKANTVYFDFDRSAVRSSERIKVEEVGAYLKGSPAEQILIEGHCDERGTEEYNRALGERRALALREYLINLGVPAERVHTISYGEDRPADLGHAESAWSKNRRGEFILLKPRPQ